MVVLLVVGRGGEWGGWGGQARTEEMKKKHDDQVRG